MFEQTVHVVVKVTRDCNLRCKYCYVKDKDQYKGEVMSFEVFKDLVNRIIDDRAKSGNLNKHLNFTFHGGEPTIIGYDTFHKYVSYVYNKFTEAKLRFSLSIQTNTTLLDKDFLRLFKDYNISVGISYDGKSINNEYRTTKESKYYEKVIKLFKQNHVSFGNICIVHKGNINNIQKNTSYFKKIGLNGKYNYAEDVLNIGDCEISGEEYFNKCVKPMMDKALKARNLCVIPDSNIIRVLEIICKNILLQQKSCSPQNDVSICYNKFCGGGLRILEVSPDGSINSCGRYTSDHEMSSEGSIYSKDFLGLTVKKKYYTLMYNKHLTISQFNCDLCNAADICDYGCMAFMYEKSGKWGIDKSLVCNYFKNFRNYIYENEEKILEAWINYKLGKFDCFYLNIKKIVTNGTLNDINSNLSKYHINHISVEQDDKWKGEKDKCTQVKLIKNRKTFNIWH